MPLRFYINYFSDYLIYIEKLKVGQINDPEGLKKHIAYRNFPMQPVKNSFEFLDIGINETWKVTEPILILHSPNDITADYDIINEIIEEAKRRAGKHGKLTLRLRELGGLIRAAGDIALGSSYCVTSVPAPLGSRPNLYHTTR